MDLDTLLKDAGRPPTVPVDADAIRGRGRRRAALRRVAVGASALALAGVVAVGVGVLLDGPGVSVDPGPVGDPSEPPADERGSVSLSELGVTVADVMRSHDGAGGLHVRIVGADGLLEEFSTAAGSLPPLGSHVAVTPDFAVVFHDAAPNLLVGGPEDPVGTPEIMASEGRGWIVLGTTEVGEPLVTPAVAPGVAFDATQVRNVFRLDLAGSGVSGVPGIDAGTVLDAATPVAAASATERLALVTTDGAVSRVTLFLAGVEEPTVLVEVTDPVTDLVDVAFVGDEVWVLADVDGAAALWIAAAGGGDVRRVPLPVGRDGDASAAVDLQALQGTEGWVATLSTVRADDTDGPAWSIDIDAVRAAAAGSADRADLLEALAAEGAVHLLPPVATDPPALAACATDPALGSVPIDGVWLPCPSAPAPGRPTAWMPVTRFAGTGFAGEQARVEAYVRAVFDGPTVDERAAGLSPVVSDEVATLGEVSIEGSTVTVDVVPGAQVGILGTSHGGAVFTTAIAGAVLQFDAYDALVLMLDGSCQAWGDLVQAGECVTYDAAATPWGGQSDADALALEDGRHAVHLHGIDVDLSTVTVDVVQWLTGDAARAAYEDETGDGEGPPNDYWIVNANPLLRRLDVEADVEVRLVRLSEDGDADLDPGTFEELPDYVADGPGRDDGALWSAPFWIEVRGGVITAIEEQYVP